jgi:nucleotide-binding universal stress UspA family protein
MKAFPAFYIVPMDFSPVSENALKIAYDIADTSGRSIYLLHVAKNQHDKTAAEVKMDTLFNSLSDKNKSRTVTKVMIGDIYEDLAKAGSLIHGSMIFMGTRGAKGLQKLFGSHAEKIVQSSHVPVFIAQEKSNENEFDTIVMPFSFAKESIQVLRIAADIAKEFNSTIHLVAFMAKDHLLGQKAKIHQTVARKFLTENNIKHEIVHLPHIKSYEKELLDFAKSIDADLIAATYFRDGILPTPNSFIQNMIENEYQIPILTVNADELVIQTATLGFITA